MLPETHNLLWIENHLECLKLTHSCFSDPKENVDKLITSDLYSDVLIQQVSLLFK